VGLLLPVVAGGQLIMLAESTEIAMEVMQVGLLTSLGPA
jgi:hypothetical protein